MMIKKTNDANNHPKPGHKPCRSRGTWRTPTHLVDVGLAGGVHRLLQLGRVHLDVLAEGAAGLGQVQAGLRRPVHDHQLPGLHLVDDLLDGVAVRAPLVVDVRHPGPAERRWCLAESSDEAYGELMPGRSWPLSGGKHIYFPGGLVLL